MSRHFLRYAVVGVFGLLCQFVLGQNLHAVTIGSFTPTAGPVGTTVTINGTGFAAGADVKFGGISSTSVTYVNATKLLARVPGTSATGHIRVTVGANYDVTSSNFVVTPNVGNLSTTSGVVGNVVTLGGSNFATPPSANSVTFNGTPAIVGASSTTTSLSLTVPPGATTGPVVVTVASVPATGQTFTISCPSGEMVTTLAIAQLNSPAGMVADASGNIFVASPQTIRKITPANVVSILAGTDGVAGGANGTGSAASFYYPQGLAIDSAGNIYVADPGNSTIRKVTPSGVVTTIAGQSGVTGSQDGPITTARFLSPKYVAVDSSGNLYVSDAGNFTIRKISTAGVVSTLAGTAGVQGAADGTGAAAKFSSLNGITLNQSGDLYVADGNAIRKVTPAGVVTTFAGSVTSFGNTDGTGTAARFWVPAQIVMDGFGNLFVADSSNQTVRKITPAAVVTTVAGTPNIGGDDDGLDSAAKLSYPQGLASDAAGTIYVSETFQGFIRKIVAVPNCPAPTCTSVVPANSTIAYDAASQTVTANGLQNVTTATFYTWNVVQGQNPIDVRPVTVPTGTSTVSAIIPVIPFFGTLYGDYRTDVWLANPNYNGGTQVGCRASTWTRNTPSSTPNPPTLVSATASGTTVTVSWTKDSSGTTPANFKIEREPATGGSWTVIASPNQQTGVNPQTYSDPGLTPGTTYIYRVSSCNVTCSNPTLMTPASGVVVSPLPPRLGFSPNGGAEGITAVTLTATNFTFSQTPNQNTIKFNNKAAASSLFHVSSDGTTLIATVPYGATTGAISAKVGAQQAVLSSTFYVYPSPTQCQGTAPPTQPGSNPGSPGLWGNPNRRGTGWDFTFNGGGSATTPPGIHVVWYTFNSDGAPTWLTNRGPGDFDEVTRKRIEYLDSDNPSPATQISEYIVPLYKRTTSPPSSASSATLVGQAAITFAPGSTTKATVSWQWNSVGSGFQPNECVYYNFSSPLGRPAPSGPLSSGTALDESFSGYWRPKAPAPSAWGLQLSVGDLSTGTAEIDDLTIFDVSGNPVWLQGSISNPLAGLTQDNQLGYAQSGWTGGYPTYDCTSCLSWYNNASVGHITRSFSTAILGTVTEFSANVTVAGKPTINVAWPNTPFSFASPVDIEKKNDTTLVTVDKTYCVIASGSCSVVVSWTTSDPNAYVYKYDLNNAVLASAPISAQNNGTFTVSLPVGSDVEFELHDGSPTGPATNSNSIFSSPEVIVTNSLGALPGKPTITVPASSNGGQFTVSWSLSDPSVTSYNLQQAMGTAQNWSDLTLNPPTATSYSANVTSDGTYFYQVRACNNNGCGPWAISSGVNVTGTQGSSGLATPPSDDLASDAVGATAGSFSVDQQGNANYSIPIYAPRGAGGLTPSVSLSYNSGGGDGLVGYGWNIGGISAITPCRLTQEHGDAAGMQSMVSLDPANGAAYCLDGERMVLVGGINGKQGAQYRLESDNQTLVVVESVFTNGSGAGSAFYDIPNVFAVYGKDGTVRRFGSSAALLSYVPAVNPQPGKNPGFTAAWYQYELRDSNGNAVTFNYTCPKTDLQRNITDATTCPNSITELASYYREVAAIVPRSIVWAGGEIDFAWSVRNASQQTTSFFINGVPVTQRYRISAITVKSTGGSTLRTYTANPSPDPTHANASLLQIGSVTECVGSTCFAPTSFHWNNINSDGGSGAGQPTNSGSSNPFHNVDPGNVRFGDIDGDGRSDIVWLDPTNTAQGQFHAVLSTPSSSGIGIGSDLCTTATPCPKNGVWGSTVDGLTGANLSDGTWQLVDFNGDGRADLLTLQKVGTTYQWQVALSNGSGFSALTAAILVAPTGNLAGPYTTMPLQGNFDATSGHSHTYVADFDGDGLPDLMTVGDNGSVVYLLKPTGVAGQPYVYQGPYIVASASGIFCNIAGLAAQTLRTGDFNGDGKADVVVLTGPTPCLSNSVASRGPGDSLPPSIDSVTTMAGKSLGGKTLTPPPPSYIGIGAIGDTVTITGTNFSPVAAQNRVQFNGTVAAVISATATQLTVTVPDEATTGPIAVTAFDYTVQSDGDFEVMDEGSIPATSSTPSANYQLMVAGSHDNTYFYFSPRTSWPIGAQNNLSWVLSTSVFQVIDLNGDGLADVVYGSYGTNSGDTAQFVYQLNGDGGGLFNASGQHCVLNGCTPSGGADRVQVGDYDGDGKGDIWLPGPTAPYYYNVYEWTGNGLAQTPAVSPLYASDISDSNRTAFQVDLDGDGYADTFVIDTSGGNWGATRFSVGNHHQARNVIGKITSGLGAITEIDYAPLTFGSVYYHENTGAQAHYGWQIPSGWGAPVQDVLTPRYVVQYVDSSAPTAANALNTSMVRYRYGGYRVQGFGRGPLGFASVYSTDMANSIETVTTYNQGFPLTGTPAQTSAFALSAADGTDACLTSGPDSTACMMYTNPTPTIAGTKLNQTTDTWAWHLRGTTGFTSPALPSPAVPILVERTGSQSLKYEMNAGTLISASTVTMGYDSLSGGESYGNLMTSTTDEYSAAVFSAANRLRESTVTNTYGDAPVLPSAANSYHATWYLGRLATASTTVTPWVSGAADIANAKTRSSSFAYDSVTGQLSAEHLQPSGPADQALDKYHFHDTYGNEIETDTCSASAGCSSTAKLSVNNATGMTFNSTIPTWVQRYSRSDFTHIVVGRPDGIYANSAYAPFSTGSGALEYKTLTVLARDEFGNVTDSKDLHGVETASYFGIMGREYFSATSTGGAQQTKYRWCDGSTVRCPDGAVYRVDTSYAAGGTVRAPETWVYYDVLAREVLKVQQGFAPSDFIAVGKDYDALGRVAHSSEPYFTTSPVSTKPGVSMTQCGTAPLFCTTTAYDALGRVKLITHPNSSQTSTTYAGLNTTIKLPPNASAAGIQETKTQTRNLLGQLVTITDYNGSTLTNTYNAMGNVLTVKRANSGVTQTPTVVMTYDDLGRKLSLDDPDLITHWSYSYNALGEQVQSKSGSSCTNSFYDGQGRMRSKSDYANAACTGTADSTASWSYDTTANGVGGLAQALSTDNGITSTRAPTYDNFGRVSQTATSIGTSNYTQRALYDAFGRPYRSYFSGTGINETGEQYLYNAQGYAYQTQDAGTGNIYRWVQTMDQRGNVTQEMRANNSTLTTTRSYDQKLGWLTGINTGAGTIQNLTYTYDNLGNQSSRSDTSGSGVSISETFLYDGLQRLISQGGSASTTWNYDVFGNPGGGTYGTKATNCSTPPGPDALSVLNGTQYCYDGRGNQIEVRNSSGTLQESESYTADDKLRSVATPSGYSLLHTTSWAYGPERARLVRMDYTNASGTGAFTTTHYVGDAEIINAGTASPTVKRYLPGLILTQVGTGLSYEYLFTDNLGSTHRITDETGTVLPNGSERFTPFGQRASTTNDAALSPSAQQTFADTLTHHGFTGQEQMDESGLVHMNGRIYSPLTMRFTSADPFIQDPSDIQSYNRYSYVMNNPLVHTDPSGYWGKKEQGYTREAVAIAVMIYTGYYYSPGNLATMQGAELAAATASGQAAAATISMGFTSGFMSSGNLKGAVMGALTAGADVGIGSAFPEEGVFGSADYFKGVGAHAAASGVIEVLGGGKFGHGFISAGLITAINPAIETGNPVMDGITGAIVGGSTSVVTGGKFMNGALTGAYQAAVEDIVSLRSLGDGEWITPEGKSSDPRDYPAVQSNGILGDRAGFVKTVETSGIPGFFNPSHWALNDLLESAAQKFFGWAGDPLAKGFAQGAGNAKTIILHSQATLTGVNAVLYYGLSAKDVTFDMRSPALSYYSAASIINGGGGRMVWSMPYGDIANLYAPSFNLLKWVSGIHDVFCAACTHTANGLDRK